MRSKMALGVVSFVVLVALVVGVAASGIGGTVLGRGDATGTSGGNKSTIVPRQGPPNFLSTSGSKIVDSKGNEVRLTGVNWFGMETGTFAPHGLWERNWEDMLDQIASLGYNTIRLPYSNEMFDARSLPEGIDFKKNPDLRGLSGIEIMDKIVDGAGHRGLRIILDRHRPGKEEQSKLWYTAKYSEERWINDWKLLAERYKGIDTVIGADLHNEPHEKATWGTGDPKTDWRLAAEKAGNAILAVNPDWLIFVEGIEVYNSEWFWWGGNLQGVKQHPVRLSVPNKLVYSPHEYGPGVWTQGWFKDPTYPDNLPKVWDKYWGFIIDQGIAPVMVGEFGGRRTDDESPEGKWQRTFMKYMADKGISYTYWSFNANSGDTGGILDEEDTNWKAIDKSKQAMLATYQWPKILMGEAAAINTKATPYYGTESTKRAKLDGDLRVVYRPGDIGSTGARLMPEMRIVNIGTDPIPLDGIELRYWFKSKGPADDSQQASVLWTSAGSNNVNVELEKVDESSQTKVLKVEFTKDAGKVLGKGGVIEVQAMVRGGGSSADEQKGDYSFDKDRDPELLRNFEVWEKIALYSNGKLIWGAEPESGSQANASN